MLAGCSVVTSFAIVSLKNSYGTKLGIKVDIKQRNLHNKSLEGENVHG